MAPGAKTNFWGRALFRNMELPTFTFIIMKKIRQILCQCIIYVMEIHIYYAISREDHNMVFLMKI